MIEKKEQSIAEKIVSTLNYSIMSDSFIDELIANIIFNNNEKFVFILSKCYDYGFFADPNIISNEIYRTFLEKLIELRFSGADLVGIEEVLSANENYKDIFTKITTFYGDEGDIPNKALIHEILIGKLKNFITVRFLNKLVGHINKGILKEQTITNSKDFYDAIENILIEFISYLSFDLDFREEEFGEYEERLEARSNPLSPYGGIKISTGLFSLDNMFDGGWEKKRLYIVGGLPGGGKSAFCALSALKAVERGKNVYYFTLENSLEETMNRLDCIVSGVKIKELSKNRDLVSKKLDEFIKNSPGRLFVKEFPPYTTTIFMLEKYFETKLMQGYPEPDMIVVDYLDLMKPIRESKKRFELAEITLHLKRMGVEKNCVMVTPTQLNKETYHEIDGIPDLGNVGESFAKTQIADVVMLIKNNDPEEALEKGWNWGLFMAKNRSGKSRQMIPFNVDFEYLTFDEFIGGMELEKPKEEIIGKPDYDENFLEDIKF